MSKYGYSTLAVHAGQHPDPQTGSVTVPLYLTSTFELTGIGTDRGWDYSRAGNPTRDRLETALAALEGGHSGHAFTTGMAAPNVKTTAICSRTRNVSRMLSGWNSAKLSAQSPPWRRKASPLATRAR